jgi:type 1 glutamine amidotransferase
VAALGADDFVFDVVEDASAWSPAGMEQYALVLLSKMNHLSAMDKTPWITPAVEEAFAAYVAAGGGLVAVHSGTIVADLPTLRRLIGGTFVQHPPRCEVTVTPQGYHPITENVEPFTLMDEHYFMQTDDLQAHHFLTTTSTHGAQSGGWLREEGAEVWLHPEFLTLLRNGLLWSAKQL